ncbi:MAG: 2,3-diphosphoglycerate synthetase [Coriobacteriia bacterium]|nr:2,3-diphosphoglycerate synthetase [Coriobacteriia bacterium]
MRVLALIDGEHYPPVVRFALSSLACEHEVLAAVFAGGTEKVGSAGAADTYGVPVVRGETPAAALDEAIEHYRPEAVFDLSDEPVLTSADRFRLASVALARGVEYRGADFSFRPPDRALITRTPALAITGTGKRVGKTAISAYLARHLTAGGTDLVVLAMGRGGPAEPELLRGDEIALTTADLLGFARQGRHASSDNYEDAVMSRVTTVGCRRCGGGMAGSTFFSNVPEGARLADGLGKGLIVLEGSGAAIPPVAADATLLVIGAAQGPSYARDYFGPLRVAEADAVVISGAEEPLVTPAQVEALVAAVRAERPDVPLSLVTLRPRPIEPVAGRTVFYATTAPAALLPSLVAHLQAESGCTVIAASPHLSDRARLREDLAAAAGSFDTLVTELKAAAIDVVAMAGEEAGVPTVLADNVPVHVGGDALDGTIDALAALTAARAAGRSHRS